MNNLKLEVLISCMHQTCNSIVSKINIKTDAIVINQGNEEKYKEFKNSEGDCIKWMSTKDRGLSKSRNIALSLASSDICLFCDDDEVLFNDYNLKITTAFAKNPNADVICFALKGLNKNYPKKQKRINYISALQISSVQIAARRNKIMENKIFFNEGIGAGVTDAGGEEGIFLYSCLRKNLKIIYYPVYIGTLKVGNSTWFTGFNYKYFFDRGKSTKILMGRFFSSLYACYFLIFKYRLYRKEVSLQMATKSIFRGIFDIEKKD